MRLILISYFSLLGIFEYFRILDLQVTGFLLFAIPVIVAIVYSQFVTPILMGISPSFISPFNRNSRAYYIHFLILLFYLAIVVVAFFRSILAGTRPAIVGLAEATIISLIVLFIYAVISDAVRNGYYELLPRYIGTSLFILCIMNVIGASLGIENGAIGSMYTRNIENSLGFVNYRTDYPFSNSGRMLAIQAGVLVILGLFRWKENLVNHDRVVGVSMIAIGMTILVGNGGRVPILMLLAVILYVLAWGKSDKSVTVLLLILLGFPFLVTYGGIGEFLLSIGDTVGIQYEGDIENIKTFSNRTTIYEAVVHSFVNSDLVRQIFGYGAHGQVTSGLGENYENLFTVSYVHPENIPTHNTLLQALVDYGIAGVVVYIALIIGVVILIQKSRKTRQDIGDNYGPEKMLLAIILYLIGSSITETSISYYSFGVWSVFIMINFIAIADSNNSRRPHAENT